MKQKKKDFFIVMNGSLPLILQKRIAFIVTSIYRELVENTDTY